MTSAPSMTALDARLATVPGMVCVWCGAVGADRPAYARLADVPHYAASTMKVAVLVAAYRAAEAGRVDLDAPVPVVNDFASAKPGAPRFTMDPAYDQDDEVWARLGGTATLRWLARRMIVRSSNLAANLVLAHVGTGAVGDVLRIAGATHSRIERGITDLAARDAGLDNEVTARDLAALLGAIAARADDTGASRGGARTIAAIATRASCAAMLNNLLAQEHVEDLAAGLPGGTRVAHKNGWVDGVRHAVGVVYPDDAPPYVLAVCTTWALPDAPTDHGAEPGHAQQDKVAVAHGHAAAAALVARIAAASWADRHTIGAATIS